MKKIQKKKKQRKFFRNEEIDKMLAIPISECFCYYVLFLSLFRHCICREDSTNKGFKVYKVSLSLTDARYI